MSPESAKVVTAGGWELLHQFAQGTTPRGYVVTNSPDSVDTVDVYVVGVHGGGAPGPSTDGFRLQPGASQEFIAVAGGQGRVKAIYARSDDAVISHGVTVA